MLRWLPARCEQPLACRLVAAALGILGGLKLPWPPALRSLLAAISLDVLHVERLSCVVDPHRSTGAWLVEVSTQAFIYDFAISCGMLVLLVGLGALQAIYRHRRRHQRADGLDLALSVVFALPLVTSWHTSIDLLRQKLRAELH